MIRSTGRLMFLTAGMLLAGAVSLSAAQKKQINPVGQPNSYKPGATVRYAVWFDMQGWHVATATAGKKHIFKGTVDVIGGTITGIAPQQIEGGGKTADFWQIDRRRRQLSFDFSTKGVADGLVFQVSPMTTALQFNLLVDGKSQPMLIFIGQNGAHPGASTFSLPAFPR